MFCENKIIPRSFLRPKWYELVIALVIVVVVCIWLMFNPGIKPGINRRVFWTKRNVSSLRLQIDGFKKLEGRYPNSLSELQQYSKDNPNAGLGNVLVTEHISDFAGNSNEFDVLNNQGGWYYDKNTGEVKLNLTEPLNHYIESYVGNIGKEIPADW